MRDHDHRTGGKPEDLLEELGYEPQDIQYKKFTSYAAYFLAFFILCIILGFVIMWAMVPTKLQGGRMATYVPKTTMPVGTPLLQSNITTRTDIMSLRQKETAMLTGGGVIDQAKGVYRIPVASAIDILSKKGLPKTAPMQEGGSAFSGNSGAPSGTSSSINLSAHGGGRG
jgi:hypothetical protein